MLENEYIFLLLPLGVAAAMAVAYVSMGAAAGRSWAVMLLVFVTVFLLDTIFRARAYSDKSIDFQIILKAGSWGAIFLFSLLHLHRYGWAFFRLPHFFWLLFFCWLLVTTTYSPSPTYSAIAVFSVVALYLACLALHADYDEELVLAVILASYLLVVVASLVAYFALPSLGRMQEWQGDTHAESHRLSGITGTPNGIGIIAAWCALLIAVRWQTLRRYLGIGTLCFGGIAALLALALSQSRTSMAILLVLTTLNFAFRRRYTPYLFIGGAIAISVVAIFIITDSGEIIKLLSRSGNSIELETGTGRAQIWALVIKLSQAHFWTGRGYASSVFILPDYSDYTGHAPPHAHNMWLQLWFTTGMIGVILFFLALVSQFFRTIVDKDGLGLTFLLFVLLDGITEASAFAGVAHLSTLVLLIATARSIRRLSSSSPPAFFQPHQSIADPAPWQESVQQR